MTNVFRLKWVSILHTCSYKKHKTLIKTCSTKFKKNKVYFQIDCKKKDIKTSVCNEHGGMNFQVKI